MIQCFQKQKVPYVCEETLLLRLIIQQRTAEERINTWEFYWEEIIQSSQQRQKKRSESEE